ncbi:MAG: glycosyltransferase family 39 protein [Bryobacteraceae bacterium]
MAIALAFALAKLAFHLLTNGRYGYFRDELYYLACGQHLDWGYSDCPPLIGLIAWTARAMFGDSLPAIRLLPALAGAVKVFLTGMIAREFGGGRVAIALACLTATAAPIYLGIDTLLTMNVFEPVFWMGVVYLVARAVRHDRPRLWVWVGVLAGLGMENKHSTAFFLFALAAGLALSQERRWLRTHWPWTGAAIALAIALPNLVWEQQRNWPIIETLTNVRRTGKNVVLGPAEFVGQQILMLSPAALLVWLPGLWFLFRRRRIFAWTFVAFFAVMMALHAKNYYLAPVYPMLLAAGGVFWEQTRLRWVQAALAAAVLIMGAIGAPLAAPVLPVQQYLRYEEALGLQMPKTEVEHRGRLPQIFGDMFGWPEMVERVAKIYQALPPADRARAAIYAGNYGEAGAIDFFGPRYGLPRAISGHQSYWFWGPRGYTGDVVIVLQGRRERLEQRFTSVQPAGATQHPYAMAEENYEIFVCRGIKRPLTEIWPQLKHWN